MFDANPVPQNHTSHEAFATEQSAPSTQPTTPMNDAGDKTAKIFPLSPMQVRRLFA